MTFPRTALGAHLTAALVAALAVTTANAADYQSTVLSDNPLSYYRLSDAPTVLSTARNAGTLGATGNATHTNAIHGTSGAIAGSANGCTYYTEYSGSGGARTVVPFTAALNPPAAQPFTIEAWVKPTINGLGNAQAPLFNRHSVSPRGGWVFFQRDAAQGFNFRMYNGIDGNQSVDITGGPYTVGQWTHLAASWDGSTARLFVNGAEVGSQANVYAPNTDIGLSVGAYAANNPGDNPYTGYVDEVAWYSNALSPTQILAHYDNGTNASRVVAYEKLVATDGAVLYLRLNEPAAINAGSLGAVADGTHTVGVKLGDPGAIVGTADTAATYYGLQDADGGSPTTIPFNSALNPSGSFSVEAWVKPTIDGLGNRQCALHNRASTLPNGNGDRTGWDLFQNTASGGWQWRLFNGSGSTRVFDPQGGSYTVGQWEHMVLVYDATVPSASIYLNGVLAAVDNTPTGSYAPKTNGDFAIGSYSNPALNDNGYENAFTGSIDEVAVYGAALSPSQILSHYQNGTNAARGTPYQTLIASHSPVGYWRMNEAPINPVANSGNLGANAAGVGANAASIAGPQAPLYAGFEANNTAKKFDGSSYIELANPTGLNFLGQISIEAWVKPDAVQNFLSDILAHGVNDSNDAEVMLRLTDGNTYAAGSWDGTTHGASAPIPGGDLGGSDWIYLASTYDGADWKLYRNGIEVGTFTDATGSVLVPNAAWSIGARGRWKKAFGIQAGSAFPDRAFAGGIDEVAIYNYALPASRVATHYSMGLLGPNPITIARSGTDIVLNWAIGTLQEADDVTGPYNDVPGGAPYTISASAAKKFYRIRL